MAGFLQQCLDRCVELAGGNVKFKTETFYPLTAFSKKQTSTAMSSTEAEVIAANVALRAVGLLSSKSYTPAKTSDYWMRDVIMDW